MNTALASTSEVSQKTMLQQVSKGLGRSKGNTAWLRCATASSPSALDFLFDRMVNSFVESEGVFCISNKKASFFAGTGGLSKMMNVYRWMEREGLS
jgi:hypothetical protein